MQGVTDRVAAKAAGMDPDRLDAVIDELDREYVANGQLPHMQVMVVRDDQLLLSVVRGTARASGEALRHDALYRIASMTKPVTSVAFMMLVEEDKVALDTPVADVIPEFGAMRVAGGPVSRPMLMIDLLRHSSGLTYGLQRQTAIDARYRDLGLDEFNQKRSSDAFIADLATLPLEFSPCERWNYSVSTDVLGVVVERLTGQDLGQVFQRRIFDPLGMVDTGFVVRDDQVDRLTDAWRLDENGSRVVADHGARSGWRRQDKFASGGGGLVSSANDYYRFARMLQGGGAAFGQRLLQDETVAMMRTNQLPGGGDLASLSQAMFSEADYEGVGFGLGFAMGLERGEYYWGGVFSTYFWIDPVERLIGIFMTQLLPSSAYPVRTKLRMGVADAILTRRAI